MLALSKELLRDVAKMFNFRFPDPDGSNSGSASLDPAYENKAGKKL